MYSPQCHILIYTGLGTIAYIYIYISMYNIIVYTILIWTCVHVLLDLCSWVDLFVICSVAFIYYIKVCVYIFKIIFNFFLKNYFYVVLLWIKDGSHTQNVDTLEK